MKGYPKALNTKQDYEYVKNNFPKYMWATAFQNLLDTMNEWYFVKQLLENEQGIEDDTHKVESQELEDGTIIRTQFEFRFNPDCKLIELGYTPDEVKSFL